MNNSPLVSVVILTYNSQTLQRCIKSIGKTTYKNIEVILVDNGSKNDIYSFLKKELSHVNIQYIKNSRNVGHSEGFNIGFRVANGKYIMKVDDDVELDRSCIENLVTYLQSNPDVAAAQPLILHKENGQYLYVGSIFLDVLGYSHPILDISNKKTFYAAGAAFMIRKKVVVQASFEGCFFDPDYFIYYDELDACWRLRLATGLDIHVVYSAKAYHNPIKKGTYARYMYFYTRNRLMTLLKNHTTGNLIKWLPIVIFLDIIRMLILLLTDPESGFAILRGLEWNLLNLKKNLKKRTIVQHMLKKCLTKNSTIPMVKINLLESYRVFKEQLKH